MGAPPPPHSVGYVREAGEVTVTVDFGGAGVCAGELEAGLVDGGSSGGGGGGGGGASHGAVCLEVLDGRGRFDLLRVALPEDGGFFARGKDDLEVRVKFKRKTGVLTVVVRADGADGEAEGDAVRGEGEAGGAGNGEAEAEAEVVELLARLQASSLEVIEGEARAVAIDGEEGGGPIAADAGVVATIEEVAVEEEVTTAAARSLGVQEQWEERSSGARRAGSDAASGKASESRPGAAKKRGKDKGKGKGVPKEPKTYSGVAHGVCNLCGAGGATQRCSQCATVYYCSRAHQVADWKAHKRMCKMVKVQGAGALDLDGKEGEYVGTLRWGKGHRFPPLGPPSRECAAVFASLGGAGIRLMKRGWPDYAGVRLPDDPVRGGPVVDPSMIDGLSYPLTLAWALAALGMASSGVEGSDAGSPLEVLLVGAAEKTEERVLVETNYFAELAVLLPRRRLRLSLVGPEVSRTDLAWHDLAPGVEARTFRGTYLDFTTSEAVCGGRRLDPSHTAVIGFNTGCGAGFFELSWSWVPDLLAILRSGVPAVFTCANDYADLRGETALLKGLGANFVLPAQENPWRAMTHVHEPGARDTRWSCSSSFLYGVRGFEDPSNPVRMDSVLKAKVQALSVAMRATGA